MKKLIEFVDNKLLRYIVAFLIFFIPVYPKFPLIDIKGTWVYIRLEDFIIALVLAFFGVQLMRRKIKLYLPLQVPIMVYWVVGLLSFLFAAFILSAHITSLIPFTYTSLFSNFDPKLSLLSFLRRIEYMSLFFVGFASIRSRHDIKFYFWVLFATVSVISVYGLGQRYWTEMWAKFEFIKNLDFCFPSFQTTNEEFAKGKPLCLPPEGRITSLFGGHYDLSAYLVFVIPALFGGIFSLKGLVKKISLSAVTFVFVLVLVYTASRVSFVAFLLGLVFALCFIKQKKWIIPFIAISIFLLSTSSAGVLQRFAQTVRFTDVVTNNQGGVVGEVAGELSDDIKKKIEENPELISELAPTSELPTGTSYVTLPGSAVATNSAVLKTKAQLTAEQKLKYKYGAIQISSVSGSFLIQRALVYDISFTTRTQGEWPNAWRAFMRNPLTGSGYASITLATDNSFLRALGETGALGFISFLSFFLLFGIFLKEYGKHAQSFERNFVYGLAGGIIGLAFNGLLIDVFEASKVAESMWLLLGVASGGVALSISHHINYVKRMRDYLLSHISLIIILLVLFFIFYSRVFDNFFIADDFTWLKWAATSNQEQLVENFYVANDFFLRPVDKFLVYLQYTFFSFMPGGYYVVNLFYNFFVSVCVYILGYLLTRRKSLAFLLAFIFSFIPAHFENIFWISTISTTISTLFVLMTLILFVLYKRRQNVWYCVASLPIFFLSLISYEGASSLIVLVFLIDIFFFKLKKKQSLWVYGAYGILTASYFWLRVVAASAGFSGDYNYNFAKLIPNLIGNSLSYCVFFVFADYGNNVMRTLRSSLREFGVILNVVGFVGLTVVIAAAWYRLKNFKFNTIKEELFGLLFALTALLPFLPLGQLAPRYVYLASFGFSYIGVVLLRKYIFKYTTKKQFYTVLAIIFGALSLYFILMNNRMESHWDKASRIVEDTLLNFRFDYEFIGKGSSIYLVNMPTRFGEAYILTLPAVQDALWFIYRDPRMKIINVGSVTDAKQRIMESGETEAYIFEYGNDYKIREVKE